MSITSLRECRFNLDATFSEGGQAKLANGCWSTWAGEHICKLFGGFTSRQAVGCWYNEQGQLELDTSIEFTVAIEPLQWAQLRALVQILASGQRTVYVVGPWGEAEIVPVPTYVAGGASEGCASVTRTEYLAPGATILDAEQEARRAKAWRRPWTRRPAADMGKAPPWSNPFKPAPSGTFDKGD